MIAYLLLAAISSAVCIGAAFAGMKIAERRGRLLGWVAGLVIFTVGAIIVGPTTEKLKREFCKGDFDPQDCMDGV